MKRSKTINADHLRKEWRWFTLAPIAAAVLTGCGDKEVDGTIYQSVADCVDDNPAQSESCQSAYELALVDAERTAPKYNSLADCQAEFGSNSCMHNPQNNWFMPAMTGFMFARMLNGSQYYSQPMYYSTYPGSIYYDRWTTADGYRYDRVSQRTKVKIPSEDMKTKPTVSRTIKRGGFGSTAKAKSSWSSSKSSSRSSGWGG
ncbi:DUF1190 domain-containing protein [Thaumasiovibrio sp. DFM-14]|uniref:DUF1190 domain-containing protein n=1 Tax=Thaumasiovibrio sp. DFM-14 TaxID=3384792 RepID=UPI00399F2F04